MQILSDFPPVTKADWLAQISKDLKGAPLESLNLQVSENITANPLVSDEDLPEPLYPLSESANNWEICENIPVNNVVEANVLALECLQAGSEGLCFHLHTPLDADGMALLLKGIYIEYIGLHFEGPAVAENPGLILALLAGEATQRGLSSTQLKGSLRYNPLEHMAQPDWRYLAELANMARESFPAFRVITVEQTQSGTPEETLAQILTHANAYLIKLREAGCCPQVSASAIQCILLTGQQYFVEIARLRAFEILWLNWCKDWGIALEKPVIAAEFDPACYTDAVYTNMIKATTIAMSAALGGAQRITVRRYDEGREDKTDYPETFARRIARNVQHLLKLESGLNQVNDPAAGSYYIEHLTLQITEQAWKKFISE